VQGIYAMGGGKIVIDGNPTISSMTTTAGGAYGVYAKDANTNVTVNSGTFTVKAVTTAARGVYTSYTGTATVTIKGGSFNVTSEYDGDPSSFGAYTEGGTINIEGGNFTLNVVKANQNADLVRCGPYATAYLNVSGGTFTSEKAFYGVRSFGGETTVTGNPVFTASRGIGAGEWASATGTAKMTIDGGTYNCTDGHAILSTTHTHGTTGDVVTGDVTILDGKFHTKSSVQPVNTTSSTSYLKIKGGYFTSYTSSNVSNLNTYVVAPSTSEALSSGAEFDAGYKYHVICNHAITWNDGTSDIRTDQVLRNTMPDFGGIPTHTGKDTYEFLGWKNLETNDTVVIAKENVTYTAQWRKLEAEVYEGDSEEPIRYEKFTDAFNAAQNMHVARVKVLSNVSEATLWTLSPDSVGGSQPLTLDLNNHSVTCSKATTNTYALTINKEGCKLIIDDTSEQKQGSFNHSRSSKALGYKIHGVHLQNGELELAGGTLKAMNNDTTVTSGDGAYAVVAESGTVFTQTGGKLLAQCPLDPRAYYTSGSATYNLSGGTIEVTTQYKKKSGTDYGTTAYGVYLDNYGTFNMSGTATMSVTTGTGAYGVYVYGGGGSGYPVANMSGGSITCLTKTGQASRAIQVHGTHASANISGGNLTANSSEDSERWNVEDVACTGGAEVTVTGGNFHSTTGASCIGVRVFYGTATIGGDAYFDSRHGVVVGDWAEVDGTTATATINGGTFNCSDYVLYANETSHDAKTVTGTMYVNGGYFKTASGKICGTTSGVGRLVLNGGYYNETSSTTQKTNITTGIISARHIPSHGSMVM